MYRSKFRLFHIEDDDNDALFFAHALRRAERPCTLQRFEDAADAVEFLTQIRSPEIEAPHLIITDIKMPRMNGFEFVRWLRSSRFPFLPVIVLSGSSLADDVLATYRCGANSFSTKPVSTLQLDELIGTVLKYWHELTITPAHVIQGSHGFGH